MGIEITDNKTQCSLDVMHGDVGRDSDDFVMTIAFKPPASTPEANTPERYVRINAKQWSRMVVQASKKIGF